MILLDLLDLAIIAIISFVFGFILGAYVLDKINREDNENDKQ